MAERYFKRSLTVPMVRAAFKSTKLMAISGAWFDDANDCGCPMYAYAVAHGLVRLDILPEDERADCAADAMNDLFGSYYVSGFVAGYDGFAVGAFWKPEELDSEYKRGFKQGRKVLKEFPPMDLSLV